MARFDVTRHCPLCGGASGSVFATIRAAAIGPSNETYRANYLKILRLAPDDEFPLVECACGFVFSGWLPDEAFLHRLYEDAIDHSLTVTGTVCYRQSLLELAAAFLQFALAPGAPARPRLLDFGCGYGALLRMLGSRDIEAYGYEPSAARASTADRAGPQVLTRFDEIEKAGPFDLFICTEVLEHMPDPRGALKLLRANARPGALLAITVPNFHRQDLAESLKGERGGAVLSRAINPWEHLNYFSDVSLRRLLAQEGFAVKQDFGKTRAALNACARFGDVPPSNAAVNSLRVAKRAWTAQPSTQLFCRCG